MRRIADAHWLVIALLAGAAYCLIGRLFAIPHAHVQAWRFAAWIASGAVFAGHIAHERFRLRTPPITAAVHVAIGVAIGAFGLALWAMIRDLVVRGHARRIWRYALVLWPAITALPAFAVAWVAGIALTHVARPDPGQPRSGL